MRRCLISMSLSLILCACGGGGGSSVGNNTGNNNTQTITPTSTTSIVDNYTAVTAGDPDSLQTPTLLAGLFKKILAVAHYFNPLKSAYAVSNCSLISTQRTLMTQTPSGTWRPYSFTASAQTETTLTVNGNSECVTSMQDSGNYVSFLSDNIYASYGKCDVLFLRKKDAFVYCIKTDLTRVIQGATANAEVKYALGTREMTSMGDYRAEYATNSNGYKATITRNGKYMFSSFTTTVNGRNYIGITRFTLNVNARPTETIVWLKEQTGSLASAYSFDLRGFIALENGDVVVDYITDEVFPSMNQGIPYRPLAAAYRSYIAVNAAANTPDAQPSFVLFKGAYGYNIYGWGPGGELLNYLYANDPTVAFDPSGNRIASYQDVGVLNRQERLIGIASDPVSNDRVIYVTLTHSNVSRVGPANDILKVSINSDGQTASIASVTHVGQTTTYYPVVIVGSNIYSYSRATTYQASGGGWQSTQDGIIAFPLTSLPATERLVQPAGQTFTYSIFSSNDSMFLFEGFNGYFGGNNQGTNRIYQLKNSNGSEVVSSLNLGDASSGTFAQKTVTVNPVTNQLQISGEKKNDMSSPYSKQWSGFFSVEGVKSLSVYDSLTALSYDSPVLSLRYPDGTKPTFSN